VFKCHVWFRHFLNKNSAGRNEWWHTGCHDTQNDDTRP
jgi:hypothetical protein